MHYIRAGSVADQTADRINGGGMAMRLGAIRLIVGGRFDYLRMFAEKNGARRSRRGISA